MYKRGTKKTNMATLQLDIKDYGKYALFEVSNGDGDIEPIFLSFDLAEVVKRAQEFEKKNSASNLAIEQVKDPHVCWNY
jgi:hypothetical protein